MYWLTVLVLIFYSCEEMHVSPSQPTTDTYYINTSFTIHSFFLLTCEVTAVETIDTVQLVAGFKNDL